MIDKNTGKPRGFGFVVFESVSCVDAAQLLKFFRRCFPRPAPAAAIADYGKHAIDGKWVDDGSAAFAEGVPPRLAVSSAAGAESGASPERQGFRESQGAVRPALLGW
eukprot:Skav202951  [mRNA]  locus=scaffold422:664809:668386:+ [translate_table: standard]